MKSILLASTALVAFAGAAAADGHASVSQSLSATLGYNDTVNANDDNEIGFYWEGNLKTTATAALDNGLTAGAYFEITVGEDNSTSNDDFGLDLSSSDFVLSLEAEQGGLFFGDTSTATDKHWSSVGDMEADGFTTGTDSAVLRGDAGVGPVNASISYIINDDYDTTGTDNLRQLSFGAAADFDVVTVSAAYQKETNYVDTDGDFNADEIFGISAEGTFSGVTAAIGYAENSTDDQQSTGVKVSYTFSPVTVTGYYVDEAGSDLPDEDPNFGIKVAYSDGPIGATLDYQDDQGTTKIALDGSYDIGNGLELFAGYYTQDNEDGSDYEDEFYIAGKYDLGGGADILVSYAEGEDNEDDEIGADDYQEGTTVELNFSF